MKGNDRMNLQNRRVFITGASSGIGCATAKILAQYGATVALSARREENLRAVAAEIEVAGGKALVFPADVLDEAGLKNAIDRAAEAMGGIDIAVHCAGSNVRGLLADLESEDWDKIIDTNLKSAYLAAKLSHPHLVASAGEQKSKFLAIGSVGTFRGIPRSAAYSASKGGLVQLVRAMSVEWASENICVNAVCPGYIWTPLLERSFATVNSREKVLSRIPMGHLGKPEDVGEALAFLASPAADYITGTTLNVDGGFMSAAYILD